MHNKTKFLMSVFALVLSFSNGCNYSKEAEKEHAIMHIVKSYFHNNPKGFMPNNYSKEYVLPHKTTINSKKLHSIGQVIFTTNNCVIVKDNHEHIYLLQIGKDEVIITPAQEKAHLIKDKPIKTFYVHKQ
jgi:hypothetical protein